MKLVKAMTVLVIVLCSVLTAAPPNKDPGRRDANRLTGILQAVDVKKGTFTLKDVGVDVDEALARKLKERGDGKPAADAGDAARTRVVAIEAKTKIYIKFRTSPSVANNAEMRLADLQKMVGYPVSVDVARDAEPVVAAEVIAWRGTPWKVK